MQTHGVVEPHVMTQRVFCVKDDDRAGFDLGATGRLALMAKLAEGTGQ